MQSYWWLWWIFTGCWQYRNKICFFDKSWQLLRRLCGSFSASDVFLLGVCAGCCRQRDFSEWTLASLHIHWRCELLYNVLMSPHIQSRNRLFRILLQDNCPSSKIRRLFLWARQRQALWTITRWQQNPTDILLSTSNTGYLSVHLCQTGGIDCVQGERKWTCHKLWRSICPRGHAHYINMPSFWNTRIIKFWGFILDWSDNV